MLITVTCNECGVEFEISRDDDRVRTGRTYCEAHSVLRICPIWGQPNDLALALLRRTSTEELVRLERTLSGGPWLGQVRTVLTHRSAFDHRVSVNNWRVEFSSTPYAPYTA